MTETSLFRSPISPAPVNFSEYAVNTLLEQITNSKGSKNRMHRHKLDHCLWPQFAQRIATICVALSLGACASSPGGPLLRKSPNDGLGPLIPNCQNVAANSPPLKYETSFYLSTWSSAWVEGTQSGVQSAFKVEPEDRSRKRFKNELASTVIARTLGYDGSTPPYPAFCMRFRASEKMVVAALQTVLPHLQNPIIRDQEAIGVFKTDYFDRKHAAAQWRDRYVIHIAEASSNETVVSVYRDLWISRRDTPHVLAQSNGGNEAWILQSIERRLR